MVPSSYLRVFQPLDAFGPAERARWERFVEAGEHLRPPRRAYRQRAAGRHLGIMLPATEERAEARRVGSTWFVSPWSVRARTLAGLVALRETAPPELGQALVSPADARRAARELARLRRRRRRALCFVQQSPWHVPIRWFTLFADEERRLEEREGGGYRLCYLTPVPRAMRRAERAVSVLRRADLGPVAELVAGLHGWLAGFDRRSLLELDYGELCDLLTWDELDDDRSVRDVQAALDALARGEYPRSADLYQGVLARWAELRGRDALS